MIEEKKVKRVKEEKESLEGDRWEREANLLVEKMLLSEENGRRGREKLPRSNLGSEGGKTEERGEEELINLSASRARATNEIFSVAASKRVIL